MTRRFSSDLALRAILICLISVLANAFVTIAAGAFAAEAPAQPQTPLGKDLAEIYQEMSLPYRVSTPEEVADYGRKALDRKDLDRLYAVWRVFYIYRDHQYLDKFKSYILLVRQRAIKDGDRELLSLADFFQVCYVQIAHHGDDASGSDFSRFLNLSGPNIRIMALVEEAEKQTDAKHWSAAATLASDGLQQAARLGPRTLAVQAELHQAYADALADMGYSQGSINQVIEAVRIDRGVEPPTRNLERLWALATAAQQAGEFEMADKIARLHFHYAAASFHPYWTHYLCAVTAAGRQNWGRVLTCLDGVKARLDAPKSRDDVSFLKWRIMARARLGDVKGARADFDRFTGPSGGSLIDPSTTELDRIYLEEAKGSSAATFEALDRWRRRVESDQAKLHASQMNDVASALERQLKRKSEESVLFAERAELARRLSGAWRLVAALFALMVVGGIGWIVYLNWAARRLRDAMRRAEAANEAKSRFLANMSHELRTPLNGMLGMAEALSLDRLTPEQAVRVRTLHGSSEALLATLNDILDLSSLESDRLQIAPVVSDLAEICRGVADIYTPAAQAKRTELALRIDPDLPSALLFDSVRVRQCLSNLVSNAVKFTDDGRVDIDVGAAPDPLSGLYRVTAVVTDTGIGMSRETMAGVFGSFVQADSSAARRFGGAGLGLSITQRLANLMDGAVSVDSELGRGSKFTLTFLAGDAQKAGAETAPPATAGQCPGAAPLGSLGPARPSPSPGLLDGVRVLVVDDHPVNRQVATLLLQSLGCEIMQADDGVGAIEQLGIQEVDLVLMDINMPVMDGLEATRRIRSNPRWADLAIVALTAGASEEHRRLCLAQGMNGYLAKPINASALLAAISELAAAA